MIRIDSFTIKVNIVDVSSVFLAYQVLTVLDDENNTPTVMTNPRICNINGSTTNIKKPAQRRFYVSALSDFNELVIHFQSPRATAVYIDVTTRYQVEKDLIDPLTLASVAPSIYGRV